MNKIQKTALCGLALNISFGAYHILAGVITASWWLFTLGVYYALLSAVRFAVLTRRRKPRFYTRFAGSMLMALSAPLAGTVVLALVEDQGSRMHKVIMIAMAAYAFFKITLATVKLIRARRYFRPRQAALRRIALADAWVSIFALQRSMLASFGAMAWDAVCIFNASLGSAVCIGVFLLGLGLVRRKNKQPPVGGAPQ